MERSLAAGPVVLTAADVDALRWEPFGHRHDVTQRVLWREGRSVAGVLDIVGGHRLGTHIHHQHHHHLWVLSGRAVVLGEELTAGAYAHVPPGVEHDVDATGSAGCTIFYLYQEVSP